MKRTNRLILLIGVFLAIVAFIGIVLIFQGANNPPPTTGEPTELPTVFAAKNISLGTTITEDLVRVENRPVNTRDQTAFQDTSLLLGKVARKDIVEGKQLTADDFAVSDLLTSVDCPATLRCIAVSVDQVSGVGTIVRTGDYVDVLVGFNMNVITVDPETGAAVEGAAPISGQSAKLLLQGLQVVGHLLPPAPAPAEGAVPTEGTALTGQSEIVIVAGTAQQVEVIKFAQTIGSVGPAGAASISLALRSPADFRDPNTQEPIVPVDEATTGVTLALLVERYGVLVPDIVQAILPAQQLRSPSPVQPQQSPTASP